MFERSHGQIPSCLTQDDASFVAHRESLEHPAAATTGESADWPAASLQPAFEMTHHQDSGHNQHGIGLTDFSPVVPNPGPPGESFRAESSATRRSTSAAAK